MTDAAGESAGLFSHDARRRESLLTAFEEAWFRGETPRIADYLREPESAADSLLEEFILIDMEMRLKRADDVRVETYLERYPSLAGRRETVLRLLGDEFGLRRRNDPSLSASEYLQRFPALADAIREMLPAMSPEAARPGPVVTIRVIDGPHRGFEYRCEGHQSLVAGRAKAAQLRLNRDPHFSRHHFRIEIAPPEVRIVDLDSRSGTFVNGTPISTAWLSSGDVISGGRTRIQVAVSSGKGLSQIVGPCPPGAGVEAAPATALPRIQQTSAGGGLCVPGYRPLEEIRRDTMGRTVRDVNLSSGETVAVRLIMPARAHDYDAARQFVREASLLSRINHPAILKTREVGLSRGLPYLVTEDIAAAGGGELLPGPGEPRKTRVACAVACELLEALGHAHRRGLVHGDIRPSNVLLARDGGTLRVRLADFGLARIYQDAGFSGILDEARRAEQLGFAPPERILDCRSATPAGDLYAVGVLLYGWLAGRGPYELRPGPSVYATILAGRPTPLAEVRPDLPRELCARVDASVARAPDDRYATALAMREALRPFSRRGC